MLPSLARLILVVLETTATGTSKEPTSAIPATCVARFERARAELIERGFAPTTDKDSARWVVVRQTPSSVALWLEMRTSADGAATAYTAFVERPRIGLEDVPRWRARHGRYCCNEHATREDRLFRHVWSRARRPLRATVSIIEFEAEQHDPAVVKARDLFAQVARYAADDCLAGRAR
ncbi:MAG TPA: hypothetical protein VHU40_09230 [Polyangia bacterium]|jgi:hypothetical protein|nr:hypothetical protein [Polyangia bacterium]